MRRPAKRRQRALRPRDRAPKGYNLLEPSRLTKAGAAPRRREAERTAISDGMRHRQRREPRAKAVGNSDSPFCSVVLEARRGGPAGVGEGGKGAGGFPRNLGDLVNSSEGVMVSGVSPSKGTTDAERDGCRGVVAARSTDEAGVAARATLWREGAVGSRNHLEERWQGHRPLKTSQRNSNG